MCHQLSGGFPRPMWTTGDATTIRDAFSGSNHSWRALNAALRQNSAALSPEPRGEQQSPESQRVHQSPESRRVQQSPGGDRIAVTSSQTPSTPWAQNLPIAKSPNRTRQSPNRTRQSPNGTRQSASPDRSNKVHFGQKISLRYSVDSMSHMRPLLRYGR